MTHPIERASVEQADRMAAAALVRWQRKATEEWNQDSDKAWQFFVADFSRAIMQGIWDEHPVVQAFARHRQQARDAGFAEGVERARGEIINTPETADFMAGVPIEAAHQRERGGVDHDAGKSPFDWFWLIGYLSQKAADAAVRGDAEKSMHHTISTAAALANWHAALAGKHVGMRPGIGPENGGDKPGSAHALASALSAEANEGRCDDRR